MTIVVLLILAVMWAAVLVPPWLRNRSENRPADSIVSFRRQLSILERATPGSGTGTGTGTVAGSALVVPLVRPITPSSVMTRREARRRRRDVLFTLLGAAGLTFLLALALGGPVIFLHLLVDALLVGYVTMLVRVQRAAAERETKVRFLPTGGAPEPALLLRRSAN